VGRGAFNDHEEFVCYLVYSDHGSSETDYDILTLNVTAERHRPLLKKRESNGILKTSIRLANCIFKILFNILDPKITRTEENFRKLVLVYLLSQQNVACHLHVA
jgi:hypothetical protein